MCMYIYSLCMHVYVCTYTYSAEDLTKMLSKSVSSNCVYVHMHVRVHVCMPACTYVRMHACCTYVCVYTSTHGAGVPIDMLLSELVFAPACIRIHV